MSAMRDTPDAAARRLRASRRDGVPPVFLVVNVASSPAGYVGSGIDGASSDDVSSMARTRGPEA